MVQQAALELNLLANYQKIVGNINLWTGGEGYSEQGKQQDPNHDSTRSTMCLPVLTGGLTISGHR